MLGTPGCGGSVRVERWVGGAWGGSQETARAGGKQWALSEERSAPLHVLHRAKQTLVSGLSWWEMSSGLVWDYCL